jgi:AraC family transcriptional regulator of adaptative response/methylated-DNA-[protein]-cysteine methyltransferase
MWKAFSEKDPAFDGTFFVAVKTTGIFCRPVCRAKPPRPDNVEFFPTAREAVREGYRACKLCRPLEPAGRPPEGVRRLIDLVAKADGRRLTDADLHEIGIDPSTARRQFRRHTGITFAAYQRTRRLGAALQEVRAGSPLAVAQVGAGFESESGFREAFARTFGTTASRAEGVGVLTARWFPTPLGTMVGLASEDGVVILDFVDRKGLERAVERARRACRGAGDLAAVVPGENRHLELLSRELAEYFAGARGQFSVRVAACAGTAFERRAWGFLKTIPYGETRSYGQQAAAMGCPNASRAVGRANGMNYVSIVIPCHRVVGASGELTGYGGGLQRKRWLLDHERRVAARLCLTTA